ncbi:hypothetical protein ACIQ6Y_36955 [Streptomyces sp. NPDC096205]|uniref:hypothetical protein n=1 Tax=Streptomyces sp. NPDC096205 TaxID=3366081 RepID=UPI0038278EC8
MFSTRARHTAAAALAAAVLMTTAACGGSDGAERDTKPAAKALTEDQLRPAALAEGDVGAYTSEEPVAALSDDYTARPEVCQPLVSVAKGATSHDPVAEIARAVSDPYAEPSIDIDLHLRSYDGQDAAAVMEELGKAGEKCADGFTEERSLVDAKVVEVETLEAPAVGDEAYAFRITTQDVKEADVMLYDYLTVIRSGSTTLSFRADTLGTQDFGGVPQDVIDAQWEKFERTAA